MGFTPYILRKGNQTSDIDNYLFYQNDESRILNLSKKIINSDKNSGGSKVTGSFRWRKIS
jgi:hypothetical protein